MKTLAKTKKPKSKISRFEQWLNGLEIPTWVKRRIIAPILVTSIFLLGAFFQFNFPFFAAEPTKIEYHAAELTANEKWRIDQYTCGSMQKLFDLIEDDSSTKEDFLTLARTEEKATALLLKPWNTYAFGKKLTDDWHGNAHYIWTRVILMANLYEYRNEPWFAEKYPGASRIDDFAQYLTAAIEAPFNNGRPVHWVVTLKRCVFEDVEPAATPIVVSHSSEDKRYCPIYGRLNTLNFDDPQSIAIFAQNNLPIVSLKGSESANWSQVTVTLSSLLESLTDAQKSVPDSKTWQQLKSLAPMQVITHRLDLLCGA
jgi:hypothetical protein